MPRRQQDAKLFVKFYTREVLNQAKSYGATILGNNNEVIETIEGAGKPVHDNVDYVNITIPGDRENIVDRPVMCCNKNLLKLGAKLTPMLACGARKSFDDRPMLEECDVHRFLEEFTAYRAGQEEQTTGTDLKLWPGIDRASVADLAFYNIFTVEQLAELNDSLTGPRFLGLKTRAKDYLEAARKGATVVNLRAELDARDKAIAAANERSAALEKQMQELIAANAAKDKPVQAGKEKR